MKFFCIISLLFFTIPQTMIIDESVLSMSFSDLFKGTTYVELEMSNTIGDGLSSYDYCTVNEMAGQYNFLGVNVEKLAVKIDKDGNLKEVLIILKIWDTEHFYKTVTDRYGMPDTSSLSKFYIEKHGFKIPTQVPKDSLNDYYNQLPKPEIKDFPEIQSLAWYDINKNSKNILTDLLIRNKTNPANNFEEKEIWISFKRAI